ncbi:MAG TPA: hypothetical protein DEQ02_02120, partial [Ruminococcaceae bacterium]|nr:hypothetical protein [Oscillospiraceae bacterium]
GMTGSILFMRYCFLFMWSAVSIFAYARLRKHPLAGFAVISFFLFAPLDYMSISYNSVTLASLVAASVIFIMGRKKPAFIAAGVLLSFAVLCTPPLALLFVIYCAAVFVKRKSLEKPEFLKGINLLCITCGVVFVVLIFTIFVLSRAGIGEISKGIEWMFVAGEHERTGVLAVIREWIINAYRFLRAFPAAAVLGTIACAVSLFDKNRQKRRILYLVLTSLAVLISLLGCLYKPEYKFNYVMIPFIFLGLQCFILTKKKEWRVFILLFCTGIFYALTLGFTSNLGIVSVGQGLSLSVFASFLLAGRWYAEHKEEQADMPRKSGGFARLRWAAKIAVLAVIGLCAAQIGCELYLRYQRNYLDEPTGKLTVRLESGAAAGLHTSPENARMYMEVIDAIEWMNPQAEDTVFFGDIMPWAYLSADARYGAFSSWFNVQYNDKIYWDVYAEKQRAYWREKPDKLPDCAYLPKDSPVTPELLAEFINLAEFEVKETEAAYIIRGRQQ